MSAAYIRDQWDQSYSCQNNRYSALKSVSANLHSAELIASFMADLHHFNTKNTTKKSAEKAIHGMQTKPLLTKETPGLLSYFIQKVPPANQSHFLCKRPSSADFGSCCENAQQRKQSPRRTSDFSFCITPDL